MVRLTFSDFYAQSVYLYFFEHAIISYEVFGTSFGVDTVTWQHFLQERRALPFNLTAILDAQLTRSTDHKSTDKLSEHSETKACDRHACYQLAPASRCSNACCRHIACCPPTVYAPFAIKL